MNIFVLHAQPRTAARMHCDKHVVKMVMETAQLLSTAHYLAGSHAKPMLEPTHINHPCSVWARDCAGNYGWLWMLGVALCDEYTHRYQRTHSYDALLRITLQWMPRNISRQRRKPFVYCGPAQYYSRDPIASYRAYYIGEKARFARWKSREVPSWFNPPSH